MATLSVKLVIDKEKSRVVFAESDKDFVDILFSFLTLPMGTIVRLLGKKSGVGCMDNLYESVENLDMKYLQTKACRMMLLQPRGASEMECEDLVINVDDLKPRRIYSCPKFDCLAKTHCLFSNVPDAQCPCGDVMNRRMEWVITDADDSVFVKGEDSFMITDDLNITPISTSATLSLLQRLGITDADALENRTVEISRGEVLSLLKRTLISGTPLTDVFLRKPKNLSTTEELKLNDAHLIKPGSTECSSSKTICFKLLESKSKNIVVYAEAGQELADILFSFLTFPLGSIVKLLNKNSALGCVDNLYRSVEVLSLIDNIKSTERKEMLLVPKLGTHFGCTNQILKIDEKLSALKSRVIGCKTCHGVNKVDRAKGKCCHGVEDASITKTNPKLPTPGTDHGGGFAKGSKFMVTNDLTITPLSPTIGLNQIKQLKVPITSLVERDIICGEAEVLSLLKACLISRSVLNKVFTPNSGRKRPKIESV